MHRAGQAAHGPEWQQLGPEMVRVATQGRTTDSNALRPDEINYITQQLESTAIPF